MHIVHILYITDYRGKQASQSTDQDTVGAERPIPRRNASIQCSESEMDLERHEDASESEEDEGKAAARRVLLGMTHAPTHKRSQAHTHARKHAQAHTRMSSCLFVCVFCQF